MSLIQILPSIFSPREKSERIRFADYIIILNFIVKIHILAETSALHSRNTTSRNNRVNYMASRKCRKKMHLPPTIRGYPPRPWTTGISPAPTHASSGSSGESFIHSVVPLIKKTAHRNIKVFTARRGAAKRQPRARRAPF